MARSQRDNYSPHFVLVSFKSMGLNDVFFGKTWKNLGDSLLNYKS